MWNHCVWRYLKTVQIWMCWIWVAQCLSPLAELLILCTSDSLSEDASLPCIHLNSFCIIYFWKSTLFSPNIVPRCERLQGCIFMCNSMFWVMLTLWNVENQMFWWMYIWHYCWLLFLVSHSKNILRASE